MLNYIDYSSDYKRALSRYNEIMEFIGVPEMTWMTDKSKIEYETWSVDDMCDECLFWYSLYYDMNECDDRLYLRYGSEDDIKNWHTSTKKLMRFIQRFGSEYQIRRMNTFKDSVRSIPRKDPRLKEKKKRRKKDK